MILRIGELISVKLQLWFIPSLPEPGNDPEKENQLSTTTSHRGCDQSPGSFSTALVFNNANKCSVYRSSEFPR